MVGREYSEKLCAGPVSHQVVKRRLYVHAGCDRKLASRSSDFAGRHAEVFEKSLRQTPAESLGTDGKCKTHFSQW
jgi:hypothetical protein